MTHYPRRILVAGALLIASLVMGSLTPRPAYAAMGCMSDPYVVLSNGVIVHMYAFIYDANVGDVRSVTYTLAGPAGTSIVRQVSTDGLMGTKERFRYFATNPAGRYDTTTFVQTATRHNPVTATTSAEITSSSVNGWAYQPLQIHIIQ